MRQVGTLPDRSQAQRFVDYLTTHEIDARADEDAGGWVIWVMDEEQVPDALEHYKDFIRYPDDPRFAKVAGEAERIRRQKIEKQQAAAKNVVEMRGQWSRGMTRKAPATFLLIAACVVVFMFTHMASAPSLGPEIDAATANNPSMRTPLYRALAFRDPFTQINDRSPYRDIERGQVWRLVTTMLLHGDHWHLFFNMYMLFYFGGQMESRKGWAMFLAFVVVASVFASLAQVTLEGPNFVGMSGVVYALFGYIWMKARFDPRSGFFIGQFTIIILIAWFFAGFLDFGMFKNIANGGHGGGLLFGVVVGYLPELVPALRKYL